MSQRRSPNKEDTYEAQHKDSASLRFNAERRYDVKGTIF